jgi:RimJ/RimL family protein N-acetyltransferase
VIPLELRTERLLLRQWRDSDAEPLARIYAQPEFVEHMGPQSPDAANRHVSRFRREWDEEGLSQWAAEDPKTGRLIGRLGLLRHHDWPVAPDPVEVGWVLDRAYWGRGLATEAGQASLDLWRTKLDDAQLISITTPENVRSRAVMERLGLTKRGATHWHQLDVVWYAVDR